MKRKQLTALVLSAAMVLANAGIGFAAVDVGKRGETEKDAVVWVTLNANGGEFCYKVPEEPTTPATPSDASPSNAATKASSSDADKFIEQTGETMRVGGPVTVADIDNYYYMLFGDAKPEYDSAEENWSVLTQGPETPKDNNLKFDGWYVDVNNLTTKVDSESKLYGAKTLTARWIDPSAIIVDGELENTIQDVRTGDLAEGNTLKIDPLNVDLQQSAEALTDMVNKVELPDKVASVKLADKLIQLDITVEGGKEQGPVGIIMKNPFDSSVEKVLVIHLSDNGKEVQDVQFAVLDRDYGMLSFTAKGFSPYILAAVENVTEDPGDNENPGDNDNKPGDNDNKPGDTTGSDDSGSGDDSSYSGSGSSSGSRRSSSANTISGNWQRDNKGWWFQLSGGGYARNQWGKVKNVWYYFNNEGYVATGWQQIGGQWYYLTETEEGQGGMVTGWHFDTHYQKWFYLSADGSMLTDWQQIDGKWYYLNASSDGIYGAMAANTTVGGYHVNADGVWVQ